jgi:hypothetical protein
MALPAQEKALEVAIDADKAQELAEVYLLYYVGDLLGPGVPQLSRDGRWVMPILLSNARQGDLGEVGTIAVDAQRGQVLFSEEDRAKVKASARLLAGTASP